MWTSHHMTVTSEISLPGAKEKAALIRKVIRTTLLAEGISCPCEVNVLFLDDEGIREVNREQRQIDAPTDVLSFPMLELRPGQPVDPLWADPGTNLLALGDVLVNFDRTKEQAMAFGHSIRRELAYLVVHSVLHLLGYDHIDEGEQKAQMRAREEHILAQLGIIREEEVAQ